VPFVDELRRMDAKAALYTLAREGKIPAQKVGRHWRFHRAVMDRWLGDKRAK